MQLALQLYTVRDAMTADLRGTLQGIGDLGIQYVELAGTYGLSGQEFAEELRTAGLTACSAHIGLADWESNYEGSLDLLRSVWASHTAVPWIDIKAHEDAATFGEQLQDLAAHLDGEGIQLSYHNHAFELDGEPPLWLDRLFESSPTLNAQLDLGWIQVAGQNPVDYIERYSDRLPTVHLKEFSGDKSAHDAIAGEGWLDWDSILPKCEAAGVKFGIIEMDTPPGDALEAVGKCAEFFRGKGLS